ncbi:EAL domain-containing protein [Halomonas sp. I5-271120]|uniref:EAL domain-containing protein n=1 Tax=Halomonas sp. I5-271120 TaxID=3061632 RepID=UPI00271519FF|nr:EAL domain-containing protein [Halomonas sp. I5-271120]
MAPPLASEQVFRELADGLALDNPADSFFSELAVCLARILRVDHVIVACIDPSDNTMARTLGLWSRGRLLNNFSYPLAGSPCERVIRNEPCHYPEKVCAVFPDDDLLADLAVESYLGMPIIDRSGETLGLIAVLDAGPLWSPDIAREALRIAAMRVGAELSRQRIMTAVEESERRLDTLMSHLPGMAYQRLHDREGSLTFVSHGAEALTGFDATHLTADDGYPFMEMVHPDDRQRIQRQIVQDVEQRRPYQLNYRLRTADGDTSWVSEQGQAVFDAGGKIAWLEGFIFDNTRQYESRRIQQAVMQIASSVTAMGGKPFFDQLVDHLTWALDADAGIIATIDASLADSCMSTQAAVIDGRKVENFSYALKGTPCEEVMEKGVCIITDKVAKILPPQADRFLGWARGYIGLRLDHSNGDSLGLLVVMFRSPLDDPDFVTTVLKIFAANAAAELERQMSGDYIKRLAFSDPETGLPNRASFMAQVSDALEKARSDHKTLGLLLMDLRRFKEINDTFGHSVGDSVLAAAGQRFCGMQHQDSELLARLGGDEFAVLIEAPTATMLADRMLCYQQSLEAPLQVDERWFMLDVSIGGALYPEHGMSPGELFQHASLAAHHAKRQGEGRCLYDEQLGSAILRRQQLLDDFILAMRDGRLMLQYQPQVDLATGALSGAEVLCRWFDDERGWVSPGEFIPLAEERGLMKELGGWVLKTTSKQLRDWKRSGVAVVPRISVNVSAQQLEDVSFGEEVALHTMGVCPANIGLELTESGFMRDPEQAIGLMQALKAQGFGLAIDDFGTGYSSLAYLKRFAADTLKIDISFVRDMLSSSHDYTIVTTIIAMARSMGMKTVAEGVETIEQAQALAELGCDQAQGFYYGRPMSAEDFAMKWLQWP